MNEGMTRSLQDNILTLACYSDTACKLVRSTVDQNLFTSSAYRIIIGQAYAYIDLYGEAPKDHIADELEGVLSQENEQATESTDRSSTPSLPAPYALTQSHPLNPRADPARRPRRDRASPLA